MRPAAPTRLFWLVAFAALLAGGMGVGLWAVTHRTRLPQPEPAVERVRRQVREQAGRAAELRYAEAGNRRALCGYIGRTRGGKAVAFVSIPNRILFSDDPLPIEFREMRQRYCPGFLQAPPPR